MELRTVAGVNSILLLFLLTMCMILLADATVEKKKAKRIGKDVRDMTDADLEYLLDQWEV